MKVLIVEPGKYPAENGHCQSTPSSRAGGCQRHHRGRVLPLADSALHCL